MIIIVLANVIVMFAIAFQYSRPGGNTSKYFWPALTAKIAAGIILGMIYTYYYATGDTFVYHADAGILHDIAKTDFTRYLSFLWDTDADIVDKLSLQQPRAIYLTKISSIFSLFTFNNYWLIASWFSFISFLSSWALVKEIISSKPEASGAAVFAFLFFPSVVLWSSGLIKESLAIATLYFIVKVFIRLWLRKQIPPGWYLMTVFSLWVLWNLKYYYLAILLPVIITELAYRYLLEKRLHLTPVFLRVAAWLAMFFVPLMLVTVLHPNFRPSVFLEVVITNHDAFVASSPVEGVIHYHDLHADPVNIMRNVPEALVSGMFRPFLWEARNFLQYIAALENAFILMLALLTLIEVFRRKKRLNERGVWLIIVYSFLLCIFLALSVPNFGTLSRYRVGFLPFMVLLFSYRNPAVDMFKSMTKRGWRFLV